MLWKKVIKFILGIDFTKEVQDGREKRLYRSPVENPGWKSNCQKEEIYFGGKVVAVNE